MAQPTRRRPIDKLKPSEAITELGQSGLDHSGGQITDEITRDLQSSTRRHKLYREMRDNSPVLGGAFLAIENLLRRVAIRVEPGTETPEGEADAEFVRQCLHDLQQPWGAVLSQALTMLHYGWSLLEIVYKRRGGMQSGSAAPSKYTDGKYGWSRFALRGQESLDRWGIAASGEAETFTQRPAPSYQVITIAAEKYLLFRTTAERNSPEGRSLLRNCVMPWRFVKRFQELEGIGIERDLAGLPIVWAPAEVLSTTATGDALATQNALKTMVTNIRRDEQEGVLMPLAYDSNGNKRYDLTLLSTAGSRQFNINETIGRYEQRMLMALLADFILLGHEKVGSFSLSVDKTDLFAVAIATYLQSILDVFNADAIPRLFTLNGMRRPELPKLTHGDIESPDLAALADYLQKLAGAGLMLPDNEGTLQAHLMRLANLPADVEQDDSVGKRAAWANALAAATKDQA